MTQLLYDYSRSRNQLVLLAGAMGNGGEVFLLDMGEPVKLLI